MATRKKQVETFKPYLVIYQAHYGQELQESFSTQAEAEKFIGQESCGPDEAEAYFIGRITHKVVEVSTTVTTELIPVK